MARSEYQSYSLWKTVQIIGFIQPNSKAAAMEHHTLDQEVRHLQLLVLILVTCHGAV